METNKIIEGKKLISEFMEYYNSNKLDIQGNSIYHVKILGCNTFHTVETMPLNSSWDWLMPVVEKIESLEIDGFPFVFTMTTCNIFFEHPLILDNSYIVQVERTENMMNDIYIAVVEFIKWYNQNN